MLHRIFTPAFAFSIVLIGISQAQAQYTTQPIEKPFSNYQQPAAVSPWLNLFRNDGSSVSNYLTLVEPQLKQQKFNEQQQRINQARRSEAFRQERQLQNLSLQYRAQSQPELGPTGSFQNIPAGSRFMNFSHFFGGR